MKEEIFGLEAYSPRAIAETVERVGVTKARLPLKAMFALAVLAGGFVGLGAHYSLVVSADPELPFALSRALPGLAFSLGLGLVVVAGAELFTGNNLLAMAWADRKITTRELLRSWSVVLAGNAVGAGGLALLVWLSGAGSLGDGAVAAQAVRVASAKAALPFARAFLLGILCNVLVCLAVWLAMAGQSVTDRIVAVVLPVSAFVAAGFEHSVANLYFLPLGALHSPDSVSATGAVANLVAVTLGNVFGGSVMVALVYHVVYRR